jgi:hypothetical protein
MTEKTGAFEELCGDFEYETERSLRIAAMDWGSVQGRDGTGGSSKGRVAHVGRGCS